MWVANRLLIAPVMSEVGNQLRAAREARQLDIPAMAEQTKIKTDHLRALEAGHYDAFTAPVYIRGFVRSYASMLRMDVPQVMAMLDAELSRTARFSEPPRLDPHRKSILDFIMLQVSRLHWPVVLPVLALAIVVTGSVFGYNAWRRHKNTDPLSNLGPGMYQPPANFSGEFLPVPTYVTMK